MDFITTLLTSLGGGAAMAWALSGWLGKVWAARILAEEKAKHDAGLHALQAELQLQLDRAKWPMSREDALATAYRDALREFLLPAMEGFHSICWLTWLADHAPDELSPSRLWEYEREMHDLLPKVSSYLALLSAHDAESFEQLRKHAKALYDLDNQTAQAMRELLAARASGSSEKNSLRLLSEYYERAGGLEQSIPEDISNLVTPTLDRRASRVTGGEHSHAERG